MIEDRQIYRDVTATDEDGVEHVVRQRADVQIRWPGGGEPGLPPTQDSGLHLKAGEWRILPHDGTPETFLDE